MWEPFAKENIPNIQLLEVRIALIGLAKYFYKDKNC